MTATQSITDNVVSTDALLAHWQGHRGLTRKTIEAFPEDKLFTYSVGGMRPFAELVSEFLGMASTRCQRYSYRYMGRLGRC